MHVQFSISSENKEKGTLTPMTTALVSRLEIVTRILNRHYRTFSPSRVRGYKKVPVFQFRYLNLLIISHGWDVANQNQNPVILSLFAKPIKFLHSFQQPVTLWRNFIVHQNPPKFLSLKINSVNGKDHSYVQSISTLSKRSYT